MVRNCCAVPGCSAYSGQGQIVYSLSKDENVSHKWLEFLHSVGYRESSAITPIAVCEDHFTDDSFKKSGRPGRRKLRRNAVPSVPFKNSGFTLQSCNSESTPPARQPLEDRTNCQETNSVEVVLVLPFLSGRSPTPPPDIIVNKNDLPESPATSTVPDTMDTIDDNFYETHYLDESTGEWQSYLSSPDQSFFSNDCDSADISMEMPANHTLDESSGLWVPISPSHSFSPLPPTPPCDYYDNEEINFLGSLDKDELLQLALRQTAELEQLKNERESHLEEISYLKLMGNFNGDLQRKLEAERQSNLRMQRCRETFSSPWLSEAQIIRLQRKSGRGLGWETEEVREGLILKMKCGSTGYDAVVKRYPLLPSLRSLQESVQHIRFDSGILHEVFDMLEVLGDSLPETGKDCQIVLDEMALSQGTTYCNSLKKWVGLSTLPTHTGVATKALLFILAGITVRWKVAVAVEFTSKKEAHLKNNDKENLTGKAYANIIHAVIKNAENVSLKVCGVTSDMGPDNLAFWREFGITGNRKEVKSSIQHPNREDAQLFILPDAVHAMKSIKKMMDSNSTIILPPKIVEDFKLPSDVVDYRHIDDLLEYEEEYELKVAFRLRRQNVHCDGQFKSMNVSTVKAVLCHRTGVGLNLLAQETNNTNYETTAWFIIYMNTFFSLVLCRHQGLAMSHLNPAAYSKAINIISTMDYIFQHMKVGTDGTWKPVQRGMRVLCNSLLGLTDYFLVKRQYKYLMLGRFSSDCIENLFSLVRQAQAIPNAAQFLQYVKVITLSQFSEAVKGSSYEYEKASALPKDFLEEARAKAKERAICRFDDSVEEMCNNPIEQLTDLDILKLSTWEKKVIYDMCGASVVALQSSSMSVCTKCINALKWRGEEKSPYSVITEMKEYTLLRSDDGSKGPLQFYVSDAVHSALMKAELTFRMYRERSLTFKNINVKEYFVESLMYVWSSSGVPTCHSIGRKLLSVYLDSRLKEHGKILREYYKQNASLQFGSKSVIMRQTADRVTVNQRKS